MKIPFMKMGKTISSLKIKTTFSERSLWEVIQWHPCMKQPTAWLISKFMMDAFFAKQQSLTLINVILGPSIVGKNMEFPLQVNLCQKFLFLYHQLTHNMTTNFSVNYEFSKWKLQAQNMLRHGLLLRTCSLRTIWVYKLFIVFVLTFR